MVEGFSKTVKFTWLVYDQKYYSYHFLVFTTTSRKYNINTPAPIIEWKMMIVKLSLLMTAHEFRFSVGEITHSIDATKCYLSRNMGRIQLEREVAFKPNTLELLVRDNNLLSLFFNQFKATTNIRFLVFGVD
jgi:hypothetical protein